jgi:cellulose biosynthesis protein BcsQ
MDLWHVIVGRNGCGKTTRARALALAYARAGCRVLVCDPDGQFSGLVSRAHESVDAYRDELRKRAGANVPTVVRFGDGAQVADVIAFARELTQASNYVTPSVVVVDEGTAYGEATERKQANASLLRATGRRRNDAVGIIILQQQPTMLNYQSLAHATQIDFFRVESKLQIEWVVRQLPDVVRLEDGRTMPARALVAAVPTLPRGAFYAIDKRFH